MVVTWVNFNDLESVLAEEEQELRNLMTSPWSTDKDRKEAFASFFILIVLVAVNSVVMKI